jgi:hypothetical protein
MEPAETASRLRFQRQKADGLSREFRLDDKAATEVSVFLNGLTQARGCDFELCTDGVVVFTFTPARGDKILIHYFS